MNFDFNEISDHGTINRLKLVCFNINANTIFAHNIDFVNSSHRSNRVMYIVIRGNQYTGHTSVEDEQSIPEHNNNLNKKQNIPFRCFRE